MQLTTKSNARAQDDLLSELRIQELVPNHFGRAFPDLEETTTVSMSTTAIRVGPLWAWADRPGIIGPERVSVSIIILYVFMIVGCPESGVRFYSGIDGIEAVFITRKNCNGKVSNSGKFDKGESVCCRVILGFHQVLFIAQPL